MCIHANDDLASRRPYGGVKATRNTTVKVVHDPQTRIVFRQLVQDLSSSIIGHTVGNYNLKSARWRFLFENRANAGLNILSFIAAGDYYRY
jgi:hypothetical protein